MTPSTSASLPKLLTILLTIALCTASQARSTQASRTCRPGTYRASRTKCAPCPAGTYQWLPNQPSCTPCPKDTHAAYAGTVDRSLCLPCARNAFAAPGSPTCTPCAARRVRKHAGSGCRPCRAAECHACARGTVRTDAGACEHPVCPKGFITPPASMHYLASDVCVSATTGCPQGTVFYKWVRQPLCKRAGRVVCQPGARFDGKDRCLSCPTGTRQVFNRAERRWQCHVCVGHSVSLGRLATTCTPCRKGFVASLNGARCVRL